MRACARNLTGATIITVSLLPVTLRAQTPYSDSTKNATADTTTTVTFGGFVDAYYAYDIDRPPVLDRAFTTQAARHEEFNINLAFLDAKLTGPRIHGRFAAQFGTSVQANYAAEPRLGLFSGPQVSQFMQEAYAGYMVAKPLWIDAGVFFSPFGSENWISRDNWTYTRSLIADNSPYYEAGLRGTWQVTKKFSAQLHLINGWQNISETNSDKAGGLRLDYIPKDGVDIAYDAFLGNEIPDSLRSQVRWWQELIVQLKPTSYLQLRATYDYGLQRRVDHLSNGYWRGWAVIARVQAVPAVAFAARAEGYSDPEQIIVLTGKPDGLRASGASFNIDVMPHSRMLWRTEVRYLKAKSALFPHRGTASGFSSKDAVLVTSLALTL